MLSAALTRALTTPAFVAADFVPTHWDSAEQKAKFANALLTFVAQDFPRSKFHEGFYRRLSNTFGHIANCNSAGFYERFFRTPRDELRVPGAVGTGPATAIRRTPIGTFRARRRCASHAKPDRRDPQFANRGRAQATGARATFRSSRPATSRSPRRRRPLRSRTCSADQRRWPPRSENS